MMMSSFDLVLLTYGQMDYREVLGILSKNISRVGFDQFSDLIKLVHETEVHAYAHILHELKNKKGWKSDEIFTQNEIQRIDEIKKQLGLTTPENIVKINETTYYVIESKNKRSMLDIAIKEAEKDYANKINASKIIKSVFITGIAGNKDEGYIAISKYLHNGIWKKITENNAEITGLLSSSQVKKILDLNNPNLEDVEISEQEFLKAAEEINGQLHESSIHKDSRAKFISAILLALSRNSNIDLNQNPVELVNAINTRVDLVLKKENKQNFSRFIHIDMPSSEDNHQKLKIAIIKSIQTLQGLNINSAMLSGRDVLGNFYEVFLKYGNGAKEIGIVLTPRHITRFAAEMMDIDENDLVLDPTCGTGGFLVAAFDEVRKKQSKKFDMFKKHGLYGIEEQDPIISLALVNMIFRGDGKNNMIEGNCFSKHLTAITKDGVSIAEFTTDNTNTLSPITKVLMNPPFPKKKTDTKEFLFVDHALKQMQDGGLLFSVLPYSCMVKDQKAYKSWRQNLLKSNTLISVITFPSELFYPVGVRTIGVFIRKGIPHKDKNVLWLRAMSDGLRLKKGKRLPYAKEPNDLEKIKSILFKFIKNPETEIRNIPMFQKSTKLDKWDKHVELCAEAYLDEKRVSLKKMNELIETSIRANIAFDIKFEKELKVVHKK